MKIKIYLLCFLMLFLTACTQTVNKENNKEVKGNMNQSIKICTTTAASGKASNNKDNSAPLYSKYSGEWMYYYNPDHEEGGGVSLTLTVKDNYLTGTLSAWTSNYGRLADVDTSGTIQDHVCKAAFSDDGRGNSGTILLTFGKDEISCDITIEKKGVDCIFPTDSIILYKKKVTSTSETTESKKSYESYTGNWTKKGVSHDEILANGGTEFNINIKNRNQLDGYIYSQQWATQRIAEITNIKCDIENGKCTYNFDDDGWGDTGTLSITFLKNKIIVDVKNYKLADENTVGFGISDKYIFEREKIEEETKSENNELEFLEKIYNKYYSMSDDETNSEINKRGKYYDACPFFNDVTNYLENVRGVRDVANVVEPLYYTDMKYYSEDDFKNVPLLIIHLAKNEIYAMHGYIFKNEDLNNYFRGQLWYEPQVTSENFDVNVFNEYEKANLKILSKLDTYK